jgi:hypothetical protein
VHRLIGLIIAFVFVLAACGGGDSTPGESGASGDDAAIEGPDGGDAGHGGAAAEGDAAEDADQSTDQGDDAGSAGADGPVPLTGAVAYSFSTPFVVDIDAGTATPLGPLGGQSDPTKFARGADAAYIVVRVNDPQDPNLATESLVRIDAASGELTTVVELQAIDSSAGTSPDNYGPVLPVEGAVGVVKRTETTRTIETFDVATGEPVASIPADEYGFVVTDGTAYYATVFGGLARLDPASGERTDVIAEGSAFRDAAPDADLVAATITQDGAPLSAENAEALEQLVSRVEVDLGNAVFADGGVWWINSRSGLSFQDGTTAVHEALAFYDFGAGAITTYVPTGEFGARFLPPDADFDVATLGQAEMVVIDGAVYVNDTPLRIGDDSGALLRFDPAAAAFSVLYEPDLAGADYAELTLLDTATEGLWVVVQRFTITEENPDGSRTSTFTTEVAQLDPATGAELGAVPLD